MENIIVKEVNYIENYLLEIIFTNNKKRVVDFGDFSSLDSESKFSEIVTLVGFEISKDFGVSIIKVGSCEP